MEVIDFAKEQLLDDIVELSKLKDSGNLNTDRFKFKLAGILSKYEVKREIHQSYNSDIEEKTNVFLSAKKIEGLSPTTIEGYKIELRLFNKSIIKKVNEINSSDIRFYLSRFDHLKMSSISRKLSVLKSFFNWLHTEEIIPRNPTSKIKPPKQEKLMVKSLEIEDLELVRESCKTLRQRALCECFYATGTRLSELQQLNINDIDFQAMQAKVIGKGNKQRVVFFSFKAIFHLKKYLNSRNDDCEALFVTERKPYRRISNRGIEREITKIGEIAGLEQGISPHIFRRTLASLLLANNCELAAVQSILGHESPEVTLRYSKVTDNFKKEQYKKHLVQ